MGAAKNNKLTSANLIKCVDRIRTLKADIEAGKFTLVTLADLLTTEIASTVTEFNVRGIVEMCAIAMPSSRTNGVNSIYRKAMAQIEELTRRVATLENAATADMRVIGALNARLTDIEKQLH